MNISDIAESREDFHLLQTTGRTQIATITLKQGEVTSDDMNKHPHSDQTVLVLEGELVAEVGEERQTVRRGQCLIIPAAVAHRLKNEAETTAFAFSVYAPPAYEVDDPH
jgi:mannose-6-phosphate isomerase-like protein (cupin superfamily)